MRTTARKAGIKAEPTRAPSMDQERSHDGFSSPPGGCSEHSALGSNGITRWDEGRATLRPRIGVKMG